MGLPIIIPTSKEGFKQWIKIVGVILIAVAVYFSATKIQFVNSNFVKEGTVSFSEMNKTDVYEITEIIVFDNYATYTDNSYEYKYFTVLVKDSDGYSKYASLVTNVDDAVYEKVMAFNNDFNLNYGECVLNGGFTAVKMNNVKMDKEDAANLKAWFNKDVSNCQQVLNAESSDLILAYACASEEDFPDYQKYIKSENIKWGGIASALVAGGTICIAVGVSMTKKDKKKALEAAEANAQYYNSGVYFNPETENAEATPVQQEHAPVSSDTYTVLPAEDSLASTVEE